MAILPHRYQSMIWQEPGGNLIQWEAGHEPDFVISWFEVAFVGLRMLCDRDCSPFFLPELSCSC
jgi:hypothetical protein